MELTVIGASGLLGGEVLWRALRSGWDAGGTYMEHPFSLEGAEIERLDLADPGSVAAVLDAQDPDAILLSGAMKDVDACQRDPEQARRVNVEGTRAVAEWSRRHGRRLYFVSTDYVFPGHDCPPQFYDENHARAPVNIYGRTKAEAEDIVLSSGGGVIRVSLLFGCPRFRRTVNFALMVMDSLGTGRGLRLYRDLVTTPTYAPWAARGILSLMDTEAVGIFHVCGGREASRYEFGRVICEAWGQGMELIEESDFDAGSGMAPRPARSSLRPSDLLGETGPGQMPKLEDCVSHMMLRYRPPSGVSGEDGDDE